MGKVFAITSGKGGVGKSTLSAGLALAFCKKGLKVLLVDMDEGLRCLDLMLGADSSAVFDLSDILMGKEIEAAIYKCEGIENLSLIPAPDSLGKIDAFAFTKFASEVKKMFDIVIFDFPAGIDFTLYSCLPKSTLFLTVAVPDPVCIRDAAAVSSRLEERNLKSRLLINRFDYKQCRKYDIKNVDNIIDTASLRLIGIVPESKELLMLSLNHQIKNRCRAAAAFSRITDRLLGKSLALPKMRKI